MPLRLNVGLSKKVGEANFGSRGASVNVEMELDGELVTEPGKLQERIRQLFGVVRVSLNEGLNGGNGHSTVESNGSNVNGHAPTNGQSNGRSVAPRSNGGVRSATQSHVKALFAITKSQRIDLPAFLRERFQVYRPDNLTIQQASQAIDVLKGNNGSEGG